MIYLIIEGTPSYQNLYISIIIELEIDINRMPVMHSSIKDIDIMKNYYNNIGAKDTNVVFADNVSLKKRMDLGDILDNEGIDMHMDLRPSDNTIFYISQSMPVWMRDRLIKWIEWSKIDSSGAAVTLVVEQNNNESWSRRI